MIARFQGGGGVVRGAGGVAIAGLGLTAVGGVGDPRRALFAYLVAFATWAGIAAAALILLGIFHATRARWPVVLRRMLEAMASTSALFAALFVPIALGLRHLYPWVDPAPGLDAHALELLAHKRPWLNPPFFLFRAALYFAIWIFVAWRLGAWSARQDESGERALTEKQWRLGAAALPFLGISLTFAAFDWLMSLDPFWFSTIFGVYIFAGSIVACLAALTLATALARGEGLFGSLAGPGHFHSLGKLLLGFTAFWAYIAFSQLMLIWIANLPEEVPWYAARGGLGWRVALAAGHFGVPFLALLSRDLKRRPRALSVVCAWILAMHSLDLYWVIMPAGAGPHWTHLTALVGIGAAAVAFVVARLRGRYTVPVRDPFLDRSLDWGRR